MPHEATDRQESTMTQRSEELQGFLDTLEMALDERLPAAGPARAAVRHVFDALSRPVPDSGRPPVRYPACDHLAPALDIATRGPDSVALHAAALGRLAPRLVWRRRPDSEDDPVFTAGHANATIVGPGGLEDRRDVLVGISLIAPDLVYPDHRHPPEEVYLVMSEGAWRQNDDPWHAPGIGGTIYNPRDIVHAMRSGPATPLLATWVLWPGGA